MEEEKKRYTRYTIGGRRVTKEDFDKMFDKTKVGFDKMFNTAMGGVDRAMEGVDKAMSGVDKAMDKVDDLTDWSFTSSEKTGTGKSLAKKSLHFFVTIWLALFFLGFGIYFLGKALHKEPNTEPATPPAVEEKTTQEIPDVFRKL
jgi:hypothetical protein